MRVLYCALDQVVPGTNGGSTHVRAVAEGLAALGHEVHVLTGEGAGGFPRTDTTAADGGGANGPVWHALASPGRRPHLRLLRAPAVRRLAREVGPEVVIERYHNFGGEGVLAAQATGATAVLEVNAPAIDHPGSPKSTFDRALLVRPMQRWRESVLRRADLIVTPSSRILPDWIPADRVAEMEWGADTTRFHPAAKGDVPFERRAGEFVAVFAGAFRAWHGAIQLAHAVALLESRGVTGVHAVFVGDGPELAATREAAKGLSHATFTGTLPYQDVPACLAASDVGVAPFDVTAHPPLQLGFYWSPLKVFEYMASGLPVVAPRIARLATLVEDGREGVLYEEGGGPEALADALGRCRDRTAREAMGRAARARAERDFSWRRHCERLDTAMRAAMARRARP
jgi:glycosyltransferase involved in cell wall biosynthesis